MLTFQEMKVQNSSLSFDDLSYWLSKKMHKLVNLLNY